MWFKTYLGRYERMCEMFGPVIFIKICLFYWYWIQIRILNADTVLDSEEKSCFNKAPDLEHCCSTFNGKARADP
jgi:hypothetical protein